MAYVDFDYYANTYMGTAVDETEFAMYEKRAETIINAATRYLIVQNGLSAFPALTQSLVQEAVCVQIDYLATEGTSLLSSGTSEQSFTVGKVSVNSGKAQQKAGAMAAYGVISPGVVMLLEQTGLLSRHVEVFSEPHVGGWWI